MSSTSTGGSCARSAYTVSRLYLAYISPLRARTLTLTRCAWERRRGQWGGAAPSPRASRPSRLGVGVTCRVRVSFRVRVRVRVRVVVGLGLANPTPTPNPNPLRGHRAVRQRPRGRRGAARAAPAQGGARLVSEYLAVRGKELAHTVRTSFAVSRGAGWTWYIWYIPSAYRVWPACGGQQGQEISRFVFIFRPGVPALPPARVRYPIPKIAEKNARELL